MYAPKTLLRRHRIPSRRKTIKGTVDDTESRFLKHEDDNAYRRLHQGFEALQPAFMCNRNDYCLQKEDLCPTLIMMSAFSAAAQLDLTVASGAAQLGAEDDPHREGRQTRRRLPALRMCARVRPLSGRQGCGICCSMRRTSAFRRCRPGLSISGMSLRESGLL
ncbi:MAG: hypothetical protein MZU91_04890 [Desulfosudis oleivorans]|nr:hypothetical protein [Desulfosudis oleivorans]